MFLNLIYFNYIFYFLIFIGFFLPTNTSFIIPLPGVLLEIREAAFLILPIVNLFCYSKYRGIVVDGHLKQYIIWFLVLVFFTEFVVKNLAFNQSFADAFKTSRLALPLISSLALLLTGIRCNIHTLWTVLLCAIGCSVILSIINVFVTLPIRYGMEEGIDALSFSRGRIANANATFGIIGLYLIFKDKDKWYNIGLLVKIVSILSVLALLLTFNRTYLVILTLEFLFLAFTTFSRSSIYKIILIPIFFLLSFTIAYESSDVIRYQIDKRIFSIIFQETSLVESTVEGTRDFIYKGVIERISEGYWFIGLPYSVSIFEYLKSNGNYLYASKTDISIVNILIRFGVFPFFFYLAILKRLYKKQRLPAIIFLSYFLASLNTDALMNQNSIFFLVLFCFIFTSNLRYDKGLNYYRNSSYI